MFILKKDFDMTNTTRRLRTALLTGASTALIAGFGATTAYAAPGDPSANQTSSNSITLEQNFTTFDPASTVLLDGNTQGSNEATINSNNAAAYALQNSTVTVGSSKANGNTSSAIGYGNTANLTVNADLNNVTGSGLAIQSASSNGAATGATVSSETDIGVALSQQTSFATANVSDGTGLSITLDHGATQSTAKIAGNSHSATGVLNSGATLVDATANNSSGSTGIASAQSSVDSMLSASVNSPDKFTTGSGPAGVALDRSTVALTGNSQTATGVANSASNTQSISGNDLTLAAIAAPDFKGAQAGGGTSAGATGGYATASKQELAGATAAGVSATINDATGGYNASITGDVSGSTLNNDSNTAKALARGNEVVNATTLDANSVATPASGTVAAIASQQDVTGTVAINAGVTGGGANGPMVSNTITGDVTASSAVTASGNTVLADAAGNRGSNSIAASGTTIDTAGADNGFATNGVGGATANAAFAVANQQSVSANTAIKAYLNDGATTPVSGTSVSTRVSGSVVDSQIASNANQLSASASGNATLTGGNAITLTGTNVSTDAAVANVQLLDGSVAAAIGSKPADIVVGVTFTGTSAPAGATYTFTGVTSGGSYTQADVDLLTAQYGPNFTYTLVGGQIQVVATQQAGPVTSFPASYTAPPSPNSPASGGVTVVVGNDITNSKVAVNGNTSAGSATGNSAANSIVADATNLNSGSAFTAANAQAGATGLAAAADLAVANTQTVGSDATLTSNVGAVFGVSATGITSAAPAVLSDVGNSTVSVSNNTETSTVTGNSAANSAQLSATNLSNTSAVANGQQMDGELTATIADFSGAFAVVGRDIDSSSVVVDGNVIGGSTTGNDATNTVLVDGSSTLTESDGTVGATANPAILSTVALAQADHALTNLQGIGANELATTVSAGYGIQTLGAGAPGGDDETSDVTSSTLSVSGNIQSATTTGNSASNGMGISGGSIATNGALMSVQNSAATSIGATSTMNVSAPAANESSSLALNGNANSASTTVNTATNAMTVAADTELASTTVAAGPPITQGANASLSGSAVGDYVAGADYVVNNLQSVTAGTVSADATINIGNNDTAVTPAGFPTDGILKSTVALNGNSTQASATSNRSVNSLDLSANSDTASGGVLNQQANAAGVTANATTNATVQVAGYATTSTSPVDNSAVTLSGNATTARAGGNSSSNELSATATSFANNGAGGSASLGGTTDSANATFAVLNEQANSGPITATAKATYSAAFNALGAAPATVTNSAVALNGNSVASVAYGNATVNAVTFTPLNTPTAGAATTTTALASNQVNTGDVTAQTIATKVSFAGNSPVSVGNTGPVFQSSLSVNGNALSAAAYGNSATNTLTIGGNNVNVAVAHP
jgi:hypothetical protein